jgi:hypothetical protein
VAPCRRATNNGHRLRRQTSPIGFEPGRWRLAAGKQNTQRGGASCRAGPIRSPSLSPSCRGDGIKRGPVAFFGQLSRAAGLRQTMAASASASCGHSSGVGFGSLGRVDPDTPQLRTRPPSTLSVCPVIKAASSLVRNDTVPTRSAGTSGRLIACIEAA